MQLIFITLLHSLMLHSEGIIESFSYIHTRECLGKSASIIRKQVITNKICNHIIISLYRS